LCQTPWAVNEDFGRGLFLANEEMPAPEGSDFRRLFQEHECPCSLLTKARKSQPWKAMQFP